MSRKKGCGKIRQETLLMQQKSKIFSVTLLTWFIAFILLARHLRIPFVRLLQEVSMIMYRPNYNTFYYPDFKGISLTALTSLVILAAALVSFFLDRRNRGKGHGFFRTFLPSAAVTVMIIYTIFQSVGAADYFCSWNMFMNNRSLDKKYELLYPEEYPFAMACRNFIPGIHKAKFVTDLNIEQETSMGSHRLLAYFLLPIDIRDVFPGDPDCVVVFKKKNPQEAVPVGFRIVMFYNNDSLLAVKDPKI